MLGFKGAGSPGSVKRKRSDQQYDTPGTSSSFTTHNKFNILSDTESEESEEEQTQTQPQVKQKIPPIVIYEYLTNHTMSISSINDKLKQSLQVKYKQNRLILYTKSIDDYNIVFDEVQKSQIQFHRYPLPDKLQPRLVLKNISPTVTIDEIKHDVETHDNIKVVSVKQIVKTDRLTKQIVTS